MPRSCAAIRTLQYKMKSDMNAVSQSKVKDFSPLPNCDYVEEVSVACRICKCGNVTIAYTLLS